MCLIVETYGHTCAQEMTIDFEQMVVVYAQNLLFNFHTYPQVMNLRTEAFHLVPSTYI